MSANSRRTSPFDDELYSPQNRVRIAIAEKQPLAQLVQELRSEGMIVAARMYHPDVITDSDPDSICTGDRP